jgi:hypothetical protein
MRGAAGCSLGSSASIRGVRARERHADCAVPRGTETRRSLEGVVATRPLRAPRASPHRFGAAGPRFTWNGTGGRPGRRRLADILGLSCARVALSAAAAAPHTPSRGQAGGGRFTWNRTPRRTRCRQPPAARAPGAVTWRSSAPSTRASPLSCSDAHRFTWNGGSPAATPGPLSLDGHQPRVSSRAGILHRRSEVDATTLLSVARSSVPGTMRPRPRARRSTGGDRPARGRLAREGSLVTGWSRPTSARMASPGHVAALVGG